MAPPRQFAGHPWSSCEAQNERMIVKSPFQRLNLRCVNRVSTVLGLVERLSPARPQQANQAEVKVEQRSDFPHLSLSLNLPLTSADFFSILLSEPADQQSTRVLGPTPSRLTSSRALFPSHFSPSL